MSQLFGLLFATRLSDLISKPVAANFQIITKSFSVVSLKIFEFFLNTRLIKRIQP